MVAPGEYPNKHGFRRVVARHSAAHTESMRLQFLFLLCFSAPSFAAPFAEVVTVRGEALAFEGGASRPLAEKMALAEGTRVEVKEQGFVSLKLSNGSKVHVSGMSSVELKSGPESKPSLLHLLTGRIRALVTRALQGKSLLVTTKSAVLGVRGTDFVVTYDPDTNQTALVTIEGKVAMASWAGSGSPESALAIDPVMVAGGKYLVQTASGAAAATAPGAKGAAGAAGIAADSAFSAKGNAGDPSAGSPGPAAAPKAEKVPSYFLESLKKDKEAFTEPGKDGSFQLYRSK